mgnify:FL=1
MNAAFNIFIERCLFLGKSESLDLIEILQKSINNDKDLSILIDLQLESLSYSDPNGIKNLKKGDIIIYDGGSESNRFTEGKEYKLINNPYTSGNKKTIFRIKNDSGNTYTPLARYFSPK